jgi:dCTP deaminase
MILGTEAINAALDDGRIICDPAPQRVEGAHIDVRLGEYTWLMPGWGLIDLATIDPHDEFELQTHTEFVFLPKRSFSLAHTVEYIGTAPGSGIVPILHTRSTLARWGLSVHLAAGWGDEGYASRWTLEIVNPHDHAVRIPVGARVGCIVFQQVKGAAKHYQPGTRYNIQRSSWTPEAMLPRKGNW